MNMRYCTIIALALFCCITVCSCSAFSGNTTNSVSGSVGEQDILKQLEAFENKTHLLDYKGTEVDLISKTNPYGVNPYGVNAEEISAYVESNELSAPVTEEAYSSLTIGMDLKTLNSLIGAPLYSNFWTCDSIARPSHILFVYELHFIYLLKSGEILDIGFEQEYSLSRHDSIAKDPDTGLPLPGPSNLPRRLYASGYRICSITKLSYEDLVTLYTGHSIQDRIVDTGANFLFDIVYSKEFEECDCSDFNKNNRIEPNSVVSRL